MSTGSAAVPVGGRASAAHSGGARSSSRRWASCRLPRVVVGSVGVVPARLAAAERALVGLDAAAPARSGLESAGEAACQEVTAVADSNGSIEYKRQLARVLVERCAGEALAAAAAA